MRYWQIFTIETARILAQHTFYKTEAEARAAAKKMEKDIPTLKGKLQVVEVYGEK